jgi:predicted site-specific integrase-resolvase
MTSREAEQVLGVSAAGLGYMKNRGEITAIYDENTKIWLYQREQIEAIAAERSRNRRNGS